MQAVHSREATRSKLAQLLDLLRSSVHADVFTAATVAMPVLARFLDRYHGVYEVLDCQMQPSYVTQRGKWPSLTNVSRFDLPRITSSPTRTRRGATAPSSRTTGAGRASWSIPIEIGMLLLLQLTALLYILPIFH